mmetsp:Transcript_29567/g.92287  ORF Transcript_29567/g.92287 Transcript_29567/m.92287 type:complete len:221 (-) Transcript_29567:510-1172(-)
MWASPPPCAAAWSCSGSSPRGAGRRRWSSPEPATWSLVRTSSRVAPGWRLRRAMRRPSNRRRHGGLRGSRRSAAAAAARCSPPAAASWRPSSRPRSCMSPRAAWMQRCCSCAMSPPAPGPHWPRPPGEARRAWSSSRWSGAGTRRRRRPRSLRWATDSSAQGRLGEAPRSPWVMWRRSPWASRTAGRRSCRAPPQCTVGAAAARWWRRLAGRCSASSPQM